MERWNHIMKDEIMGLKVKSERRNLNKPPAKAGPRMM
jgi:hypothetical protein